MIIGEGGLFILMVLGFVLSLVTGIVMIESIPYTCSKWFYLVVPVFMAIGAMPIYIYTTASIPDYVFHKDYELLQTDTCVGVLMEDTEFVNITKLTGRVDVTPETHVYRKYVSKGVSGRIRWNERTAYEVVEKEIKE